MYLIDRSLSSRKSRWRTTSIPHPKTNQAKLWWFALLAWCVCLFVVRIYVFVPLYKYNAELFIVPLFASVIPFWGVFYFSLAGKRNAIRRRGHNKSGSTVMAGKFHLLRYIAPSLIGGFYTNSLQKRESMLLLTDVENKLRSFFWHAC